MGKLSKAKQIEDYKAVYLLVIYFYFLIATPQNRFDFLASLHVEKLIVLGIIFALAASKKMSIPFKGVSGIFLFFFIIMLISMGLSEYKDTALAHHWKGKYWKLMIVYFLLVAALKDDKSIHYFLFGLAIAAGFYELHSWKDFVSGGSYVYQQGIKRMIGTWSGGGIGAANAWGMLGLFITPIALYCFENSQTKNQRRISGAIVIISSASVIFSGTRSAMACLFGFYLIKYRVRIFKPAFIVAFLLAVTIALIYMPDTLKARYFGSFMEIETSTLDEAEQERSQEVAQKSADSRLEGLLDGIRLANLEPTLGFGPGSSAYARIQVGTIGREAWEDGQRVLQLHNVYGQIVSELGYIGGFVFLTLIFTYFKQLANIKATPLIPEQEFQRTLNIKRLLQILMFIYLVFGFAAHNLYRYQWIILFACQSALVYSYTQKLSLATKTQKQPETRCDSK